MPPRTGHSFDGCSEFRPVAALPDTEPKSALDITATLAGPPTYRPARRRDIFMNPAPPPLWTIKLPRKTKIAIVLALTPRSWPHIPPVVR